MALTKSQFVDRVASKSGLSRKDAGKAVDAFLDSIQESLSQGEAVSFTGFGKFSAQQRGARQGVNPRTGERVTIEAATVPKFSAGSQLKSALKGS
ncbi:MAG: HU family DNA-binding protein [Thermoleophilia bacterium]|nr:HU family DNA-binding protein [Thermoleophilia bacterium]